MNHHAKPPSGNNVDWNDPHLQSLLDKTEGWSLDNRGVFSPVPCELHVGWGAGAARSVTLVCLWRPKSQLLMPGPWKKRRAALPTEPSASERNASLLK